MGQNVWKICISYLGFTLAGNQKSADRSSPKAGALLAMTLVTGAPRRCCSVRNVKNPCRSHSLAMASDVTSAYILTNDSVGLKKGCISAKVRQDDSMKSEDAHAMKKIPNSVQCKR